MCICVCVGINAHEHRYSWSLKEGVGFPVAGITSSSVLLTWILGIKLVSSEKAVSTFFSSYIFKFLITRLQSRGFGDTLYLSPSHKIEKKDLMFQTQIKPFILFMYAMSICECVCVSVCGCPQRPEEGVRSHGAGVTGRPPDMRAEI